VTKVREYGVEVKLGDFGSQLNCLISGAHVKLDTVDEASPGVIDSRPLPSQYAPHRKNTEEKTSSKAESAV